MTRDERFEDWFSAGEWLGAARSLGIDDAHFLNPQSETPSLVIHGAIVNTPRAALNQINFVLSAPKE
jgi:hypothetical protein